MTALSGAGSKGEEALTQSPADDGLRAGRNRIHRMTDWAPDPFPARRCAPELNQRRRTSVAYSVRR